MGQTYPQGQAPWEQDPNKSPAPSNVGTPKTFPQGQAPWETSSTPPPKPAVVQEMHPDISMKDRFIAKNFANSPDDQIAYLKQQHPGMEFKSIDNQIVAKNSNEKNYKVLDPDLSYMDMLKPKNWGEDLKDLSDIGTDVGIGGASSLAGGAAALAAAPETLGAGSIPAAMAAGGSTNAALEALKQKAGQKLGIPQEMNPTNIGIAGAAGALSPLIMGSGAAPSKIAAMLAEKGLSQDAINTALSNQQGLGGVAKDYIINKTLPSMAESVSGVPAQATRTLAARHDEISNLSEHGVMDLATNAYDKLRSGLAERKAQIGSKLGKLIKDLGPEGTVDLTKTRGFLDNEIEKLSQSELSNTPAVQSQIQELQDARNNIFTEQVGAHPETGEPLYADMGTKASPQKAFELQSKLSEMSNFPKTNSKGLVSTVAGTPQEKQWQIAARNGYQEINNELSRVTEGGSQDLKNQYKDYIDLQKDLNTHFSNPEKTYKTLTSMDSPSKKFASELIDKIAQKTNGAVDITPERDLLEANKYYGNPSTTPISSKGATGTARSFVPKMIGAGVGYKIGGYPGAAVGGAFADKIVSPAAIKQYTMIGSNLAKGYGALPYSEVPGVALTRSIPRNLWRLLQEQENQRQQQGGQ